MRQGNERMKIQNNIQLQVVGEEHLVCQQCLFGAQLAHGILRCQVDPKTIEKAEREFCSRGLWLINARIVGFKEGFNILTEAKTLKKEIIIK